MSLKSIVAVFGVLLLLSGCVGRPVGMGGKPRDKTYVTVISLSPSTTDMLVTAGGGIFLGGRTAACTQPQFANVPIVVAGTTPDYEKILSLEPDLIIYDKSLYGDDEVAKINELGVESMAYDVSDFRSYEDFAARLASKLGKETYMWTHLDRVTRELATARATTTTKPRTTILLGPEEGRYYVMGAEGFHSKILEACGATPIGTSGKVFQEAKIETLIDWNPEIIYSNENAAEVYADTRLQNIAAVKNQRVYDYNANDLIRIAGKLDMIIRQMSKDIETMPVNPR